MPHDPKSSGGAGSKAEREWMKAARIVAEIPYPPVSAWEFNQLKTEAAVRERLQDATVYIIAQRPILWFDRVRDEGGDIRFEINDGRGPPVKGIIDPLRLGLFGPGEPMLLECGFHHDAEETPPPWDRAGSIKLFDRDKRLRAWWSPQKLLFEALAHDLKVPFAGDLERFMEFEIHYIGKAYDQSLWERLAAHRRYLEILINEKVRGVDHAQPSLEITIFALEVVDLEELAGRRDGPDEDTPDPPHVKIFRHPDDPADPRWQAFRRRWAYPHEPAVTTELEAALIDLFKPEHNRIKVKKYPKIAGGLQALGYSDTLLRLRNCPYIFRTQAGGTPLEGADPGNGW